MAGLKLKSGGSGLDNLSLAGKLAVALMFMLMVGVAYFVVFYGEISGSIEAAENTLTQKRTELDQAKQADAAYNKDLTELERRRQLELKQRKILPDESQAHAFLSAIQTVATISGVKLTSWTPQDEEPQDFYAKVPMELKLSGKFHQVAKFFHGIGQIDRIINMENIVIKATPPKGKEGEEDAEQGTEVEVQALATAFRALQSGETGGGNGGRRGGKKEMSARGLRPRAGWLALLLLGPPVGCGDETEDYGIQLGGPDDPVPAGTGAKNPKGQPEDERKPPPIMEFSETDFAESEESRNPFRDYGHLYAKREKTVGTGQRKVHASQFALDELELSGIIGRGRRAIMLTDPNGFGWVLHTGDYVGKAELVGVGGTDGAEIPVNWRVDRIRADKSDVVFIREDPAHPDIPPTTRVMPLYPAGDDGS